MKLNPSIYKVRSEQKIQKYKIPELRFPMLIERSQSWTNGLNLEKRLESIPDNFIYTWNGHQCASFNLFYSMFRWIFLPFCLIKYCKWATVNGSWLKTPGLKCLESLWNTEKTWFWGTFECVCVPSVRHPSVRIVLWCWWSR